MKNYAAIKDFEQLDKDLAKELELAEIPVIKLPEFMRKKQGEVESIVIGELYGWGFQRFWYYWVCDGPGIPQEYANRLHETHGKVTRVDGHCGCPSPLEWFKGFAVGKYHVDTQEGLKALADTIKQVYNDTHKLNYEDLCPTCEEKFVDQCRCMIRDRRCKNGHFWHMKNGKKICGSGY